MLIPKTHNPKCPKGILNKISSSKMSLGLTFVTVCGAFIIFLRILQAQTMFSPTNVAAIEL